MEKMQKPQKMSLGKILPLVESLPQADKLHLMQSLLTQLAWDQGISRLVQEKIENGRGRSMAAVLQRMADRGALSHIDDPAAWQREIRKDRPLPGRE
ncbi:MAG: hypothetical protein Q3M24_17120 [Candidatus Electrothrix aestuarii]|uniref:Uncharacterized protein n=1 Tax=Candidatus Electrothrix aestuarii TaxID=3062594 RepID=A0AAU8LSB2_9BACT|nr:hypothetical protein [Candidatus Electrothrix aestuarii]WPD21468.1 MAG: hypothetical protein SD837_14820 [Candidatus Electrothrix sp. GW3-3]